VTFIIFKVSLLQCDQQLNHNTRDVKCKKKYPFWDFNGISFRNRGMQFGKHRSRTIRGQGPRYVTFTYKG